MSPTDQAFELSAEVSTKLAAGNVAMETHLLTASGETSLPEVLASVAIKCSSPGKTVRGSDRLSQNHQSIPPAMALFYVQENGQGIPAGKLDSIFERFQQIDTSDSRKKGGAGLGLASCRKIVEQHGGQIWVERQATVSKAGRRQDDS
ncbi:ATP-binding protein [Leptolyngbya sp. BC1307]|uniref:ATP-binding protein n=1 Tax=Leptolyngbya sp. BC1307 TaxID=2029589 RepID=UPI001F0A6DF1|nr:ATP-binding protein [Leptolyngbya sp. BC1307]